MEGQPAVAQNRPFGKNDGTPVKFVRIQPPQAAAGRLHFLADFHDAPHVFHLRQFGQAELVGRPPVARSVFLDGDGVSEQRQGLSDGRGGALDAMPRDGLANQTGKLFRRGRCVAEIHVELPGQQLKHGFAQGVQPAAEFRQPLQRRAQPARCRVQVRPEQDIGDAPGQHAADRIERRGGRRDGGVVPDGTRQKCGKWCPADVFRRCGRTAARASVD